MPDADHFTEENAMTVTDLDFDIDDIPPLLHPTHLERWQTSRARSAANAARTATNIDAIWKVFSPDALRHICELPEGQFAAAFDMTVVQTPQKWAPEDFYAFKDNGSNILAVAHLDTVVNPEERGCNFVTTAGGPVVFSGALDDRLGAYIILVLLPLIGINVDVLLTVGEESGRSTASFFDAPEGKEYDWIIEFDRGGTDVVMYQYEDDKCVALVENCGARVGDGSFSDIACLDRLAAKAFNWGVGYQNYHGPRSHAFLDDTVQMVALFMNFHADNQGTRLEHEDKARCPECGREFDLLDPEQADEWFYGHDCEV